MIRKGVSFGGRVRFDFDFVFLATGKIWRRQVVSLQNCILSVLVERETAAGGDKRDVSVLGYRGGFRFSIWSKK